MRFRALIPCLALSSLVVAGCGDGNTGPDPTTTTVATTSIVSRADIDVEIVSAGAFVSGQGNAFQVGVVLTESGGVGAHINFARLEVFRATGELEERQEIGANRIIQGVGDNRLEANTSEEATITFIFRATVKKGRQLRLTMGFTDDSGFDHESIDDFVFA